MFSLADFTALVAFSIAVVALSTAALVAFADARVAVLVTLSTAALVASVACCVKAAPLAAQSVLVLMRLSCCS